MAVEAVDVLSRGEGVDVTLDVYGNGPGAPGDRDCDRTTAASTIG